MTDLMMEIRRTEMLSSPLFGDELVLRDALSSYTRLRWPTNTAKSAAKEWDLSLDEARGVVAGRTSQQTIDKIFKAGGWGVVLPVLGAVIGHGVDDFIASERKRLRNERRDFEARDRRLAEMGRDLRAGFGLGRHNAAELAVRSSRGGKSRRG
jgi:hypothetical protein